MLRIPVSQRFALLAGLGLVVWLALPGWGAARATPAQDATAGGQFDFKEGVLNFAVNAPTSLAFGPDGRLYVAGQSSIWALTLDNGGTHVAATEQIASGLTAVLGIAFDPSAPASPVKLYASRQDTTRTGGYTGVVSAYTAPDWHRDEIITGLPSSLPYNNHMTNGLTFGPDGRLYIAQGSNADSGIADPPGSQIFWPETPLSAAILVADIHDPDFDGTLTYSPSGPPANDNVNLTGGDVQVYAPGLRNPYDLVWHSNGHLYATDNGAMGKGTSLDCDGEGGTTSQSDELNLIEAGNYYGAPNRNRGRFDERQCAYHPPQQADGPGFTAPIATLPTHCSCDGILEYTSDAFEGAMQGNLVYAAWGRNYVARAVLAKDGRSVLSTTQLATDVANPLDVTLGPGGTIYVAEYGYNRVVYLAPDSDGDGCTDGRELGPNVALGGQRDPTNAFDFYDVNGDDRVTISDVAAVVQAFGPATGPNYQVARDRSPLASGEHPWNLGPADGVINLLDDIAGVISQYGHSCQ